MVSTSPQVRGLVDGEFWKPHNVRQGIAPQFIVHNSAILIHNSLVPVSPARQVAFRILCRVAAGRSFAVDLLQKDDVSRLGDADRRLATEIVLGVLRWRGELDFQIQKLSGKPMKYFDPEVAAILRMGIYQIRFLERIPQSAVVNDAVQLTKAARKRSAAGLVNVVLRKSAPSGIKALKLEEVLRNPEVRETVRRTLPVWIFERWEKNFGRDAATALAWTSNQNPPTTLCVSASERSPVQAQLLREGIQTEPGTFSESVLIVRSGNIRNLPELRSGEVMVQDEASQLVAALVAPQPGQLVLDLCAAPGNKTRQLAAGLRHGTLIACDVSERRLRTMKHLLRGKIPVDLCLHVVRLDATNVLPFAGTFERILVDAPCTGTGTLARNPEIKWRLRREDLNRLSDVQTRILRNALEALGPGGRLVYATCSLEPEENEEVVERALRDVGECQLLGRGELVKEFPALSELFDASGYFRTRPDRDGMDGFFAAVIERTARLL